MENKPTIEGEELKNLSEKLHNLGYPDTEISIIADSTASLAVGESKEFGDEERGVKVTRTETGYDVVRIY